MLQYPPSPSARSRNSYLSIENKRDSMASTSGASYETALASAVSAADSNPSFADEDETLSPLPMASPGAKVNPLHLLANSQSDGTAAPIHITRVSQDTVYVKQDQPLSSQTSSAVAHNGSGRILKAGKAMAGGLDNGMHKVANIVAQPVVHRTSAPSLNATSGAVRGNTHIITTTSDGHNGLSTPPPSPPSTESFGSRSGLAVPAGGVGMLGGPTYDEPSTVEASIPPSTPTKTAMEGSPTPSEFIQLTAMSCTIVY